MKICEGRPRQMDDAEWEAEEDARRRARGEYKERPWLRRLGFIARLVVYAALFLVLYAYWPDFNIGNRPLSTLTINDILVPVAWMLIGMFLIRALFNPDEEEFARDAWGWIGVILIAGFVLFAGFLYDHRLLFNAR